MTTSVQHEASVLPGTETLLRFRSDLRVFEPQPDEQDRRYTVYDPVTDLSYFLGKGELLTARMFDGRRNVEDVAACMKAEHKSVINPEKLATFGRRMAQYGLLEETGTTRKRQFWDPAMGISYGPLKAMLMITVLRINPNRLLDFLYHRCRWLCSRHFAGCGLLVIGMAIAILVLHSQAFMHDVGSVYTGTKWLLVHYPVVVVSIFFHEIGHALTCRHYRVRVTDFGIAVYLLLATGWARPLQRDWDRLEKRQRLIAIVMGPYASLLFAAVGILLWIVAPPSSPINTLSIVMAVSASVALIPTLLPMFNGDTYLALTEILGVPRLRQRAFRYARSRLRHETPDESVSLRRQILYWSTVCGSVIGWLFAWALLAHLVILVFPALLRLASECYLYAAAIFRSASALPFFSPT